MSKRVLYVHSSPGGDGSLASLEILLRHLDRDRYVPVAVQAYPVLGRASGQFAALDVPLDHLPARLVWARRAGR